MMVSSRLSGIPGPFEPLLDTYPPLPVIERKLNIVGFSKLSRILPTLLGVIMDSLATMNSGIFLDDVYSIIMGYDSRFPNEPCEDTPLHGYKVLFLNPSDQSYHHHLEGNQIYPSLISVLPEYLQQTWLHYRMQPTTSPRLEC